MICRCIETSENLPVSEGKEYDLTENGLYFTFTNDFGLVSSVTKEQFELYFTEI